MQTRKIISAGRVHPNDFLCDYGVRAGSTRTDGTTATIKIDGRDDLVLPAGTPVEVKRFEDSTADDAAVEAGRTEQAAQDNDFSDADFSEEAVEVVPDVDERPIDRSGENEIERECEFPGGAFGAAAQAEATRCWKEDTA